MYCTITDIIFVTLIFILDKTLSMDLFCPIQQKERKKNNIKFFIITKSRYKHVLQLKIEALKFFFNGNYFLTLFNMFK